MWEHSIKTLTYQRLNGDAARNVAPVVSRISRLDRMEGHAITADIRLEKHLPDEQFELLRENDQLQ